ncbi:hypothetical protein HDE_04935 [Halotydeus destructor]|nr:hypothetical protein HDE_04935 [Halotydeus destructor]
MEGVLIALFGHGRCTADPRRMIVTKHFFTRWLVSMFSGQEGTDYDYDPQVNETDKLDPEMFGSLVADSLMGGVGGVSLVDSNGHAQSAVMGLFSLYDDHLNVCFVMLVLNLVVFRFIVYVLIIWRANQKK